MVDPHVDGQAGHRRASTRNTRRQMSLLCQATMHSTPWPAAQGVRQLSESISLSTARIVR